MIIKKFNEFNINENASNPKLVAELTTAGNEMNTYRKYDIV